MKRRKLTLPLAGKTMLEHAIEALLASPVDLVVIVMPPGGFPELEIHENERLKIAVSARPEEGMSSSLRAGLDVLPESTRAVLVALADKPLVRPESIQAVIHEFESAHMPIVYPTYRGRQGHPVLIARSLFGEVQALRGDVGAKRLLERHAAQSLAVPVEDAGVVQDVNTPADYAALRRQCDPS